MDQQKLRELSRHSESNPESVLSDRETLYEPFRSGDDSNILSQLSTPNPFTSDEHDVSQNIAADGLRNLIEHDRVVAEEVAERLATESFVWNEHSQTFAAQINNQYPDILPKQVENLLEKITSDKNKSAKGKLGAIQRFASLDPTLISPHIDELAELLDADRRSLVSASLNVFETLFESDSPKAEEFAIILAEYIQGTGRFSGDPTKNGFEPLSKAPPGALTETTDLIPIACTKLTQSNKTLYKSRYLGRIGRVYPRDVLPELIDVLDQVEGSRALEHTLQAANRIVTNTDAITDEELDTLEAYLLNTNESVVWETAAIFRSVGETDSTQIEPYAEALINCLKRDSRGEFSRPDDGLSPNSMRDLERGSLTFQLYCALSNIAEENPQAVREAIPYAITELADPEKQPSLASPNGVDRIKESLEVGPPSRQLLESYIDCNPSYVFERLLDDLTDRDEFNQHQAIVFQRAGQNAPSTASERLDCIFELHEREWNTAKNPCAYIIQGIAQETPTAFESDSTVHVLFDNMNESEELDTAIGVALTKIDNSYLEPHLDDLVSAVQSDVGMPNTLVALVECWVEEVNGADQALIDCSDTLLELLSADDDNLRYVAEEGLIPVAKELPEAFDNKIGALIYCLERGSKEETDIVLHLLEILVEEYPAKIAAAKPHIRAALTTSNDESIEMVCSILSSIGDADDIPKLEQVRESSDDPDLRSKIDETIGAIEERTEEAETPSKKTGEIPKSEASPISRNQITLGDRIARTNSATIYEATLEQDGEPEQIALKELFYHGGLTDEVIRDFYDEIKNWRAVDENPYVVDLLGWGTDPDPWIAMERMDTGTLRELCIQNDPIPTDQAVWVGECLAAALHHTHHLGRPHYDIKPENVLFANEADAPWPVPKLADWGSAQLLVEQAGGVSGFTPEYAAPELLTEGEFDGPDYRTDLYQLGIVLYELLTGQHPFPSRDIQSFGNERTAFEQLPDPPSTVVGVPQSIDDVVLQCLEPRLTDRYQAARTLQTDLRNIRTGKEIDSTQSLAELATLYAEVTRNKRDESVRKCYNWARPLRAFVENHEVDDPEYETISNEVKDLVMELQTYSEVGRGQPLSEDGRLYSLVDNVCFTVERVYERAQPK